MAADGENPALRLPRLLRETARAPQPDRIHRLRTTLRRVEARQGLPKSWRKLRRQAGRIRDLDVQGDLLRQLHWANDAERRRLLDAMDAERKRLAAKFSHRLDAQARRKLLRKLARPRANTVVPGATVAERFVTLARRFPQLDGHNLHEFRKGCKRLRYQAEAAGATALAAAFERVQDAIGEWHDWQEMQTRALATSAVSPALRAALTNIAAARWHAALLAAGHLRGLDLHRLALAEPPPKRQPGSVRPPAAARTGA